jgi:hypothetical protein
MLAEQTAVEQRAAHMATEPLKRSLERKESALRVCRAKLEGCQHELRDAQAELASLRSACRDSTGTHDRWC